MLDQFLTLAVQHYVLFGAIGLAIGVMLNLAFTAGSEQPEDRRQVTARLR